MSLDSIRQFEWYGGFPLATIVFLVVAVIVMRTARGERPRVMRLAALYAVAIVATIVAGAFRAFGRAAAESYATEVALVVAGVCLIQLFGIFSVVRLKYAAYEPPPFSAL